MEELSKRKRTMCLLLLLIFATNSITIALEPILPAVTQSNEISFPFFYGLLKLLSVVSGTLCRPVLPKFGLKRALVVSAAVAGVSSILNGLLSFSPRGTTFVALCFTINIIRELSNGILFTSCYCALPILFPKRVATAFGFAVFSTSAAYCVAPMIGGVLFQWAGFIAPFCLLGSLLLMTGLLALVLVDIEMEKEKSFKDSIRKAILLIKMPFVVIPTITIFLVNIAVGFPITVLEQFLISTFHISNAHTLFISLLPSAPGFISPLIGYICDRHHFFPKGFQPIMTVCGGISALLWCPAIIFNFEPPLWLTCLSLSVCGAAFSQLIVATVSDLFHELERQLPDDEGCRTVAVVFYLFVNAVGNFFGFLLGGRALVTIGLRRGTAILGLFFIALAPLIALLQVLHVWYIRRPSTEHRKSCSDDEQQNEECPRQIEENHL